MSGEQLSLLRLLPALVLLKLGRMLNLRYALFGENRGKEANAMVP